MHVDTELIWALFAGLVGVILALAGALTLTSGALKRASEASKTVSEANTELSKTNVRLNNELQAMVQAREARQAAWDAERLELRRRLTSYEDDLLKHQRETSRQMDELQADLRGEQQKVVLLERALRDLKAQLDRERQAKERAQAELLAATRQMTALQAEVNALRIRLEREPVAAAAVEAVEAVEGTPGPQAGADGPTGDPPAGDETLTSSGEPS